MEWISVKDSLPNNDYVLVCTVFIKSLKKEISIDHISEYSPKYMFEGYELPFCDEYGFRKITHWMHLPKFPK